jgi:serine protease Do
MTSPLANEQTNSPTPRSRRRMGVVLGLGILAATGAASVFYPTTHSSLMASTSAAAAEAVAPQTAGLPSFANLVDQLKPAVVSVYVDAEMSNTAARFGEEQRGPEGRGENAPFENFFRRFGQPNAPAQRVHAQGSGFFISSDGYILTNNHVVDHAKRVQIKTIEGKTLDAKVVGTDAKTDLALLKVDGGGGSFPFAKFAPTRPRVGDWVLAMGNPFGLGGTVTAGIVSASGRDIGSGPYDDFLQIDAAVNKGNSGGPTFNLQGEVVGINTAIYSPSGGSIGIAFDIPADTARGVAEQLKSKGSVSRGWIGVMVQPVTADIADSLGLREAKGALIDDVQRGSPAAKAGLRGGDLVLSVGGAEIRDARDLARKIAELTPGKTLTLQIQRGGSEQSVSVTAGIYPSERAASGESGQPGASQTEPKLGLYLAPASEVEGAGSQGVVVVGVDPNGVAAEKGLQQGDVILDAAGKAVTAPADLTAAVSEARKAGKRSILMRVRSADASRYVALPLEARADKG